MNERLTNSPGLNIDGNLGDEDCLGRKMKSQVGWAVLDHFQCETDSQLEFKGLLLI